MNSTRVIRKDSRCIINLELQKGMELLSIRSSDIAFTMGAKGPLLAKADAYDGVIECY